MRLAIAGIIALVSGLSLPAAAQDTCANVTCSGHGTCFSEGATAFCLCDEGFDAIGQRCQRARPEDDMRWLPQVGFRVVTVAVHEDGHGLGDVGSDRPANPGPLAVFVEDEAPWCSDFVSWVYRVAGIPFTGGYQGGWLVPTNAAIQRWYEAHGAWVSRDTPDFATYEPQPGDYLRVTTNRWGHSAIVDHVEGDTLYTIEGNARGVVRRNRYRHFRDNERLAGFGRVEALIDERERGSAAATTTTTPREQEHRPAREAQRR